MNLTTKLPIHQRLWLLLSVVVFVLLGFVDFVPAFCKGAGMQYWRWGALAWEIGGEQMGNSICYLFTFTIILLIPSIILGLVFQYIGVVAWEFSLHRAQGDHAVSRQQEKGNSAP
jgi:hypothetical protein